MKIASEILFQTHELIIYSDIIMIFMNNNIDLVQKKQSATLFVQLEKKEEEKTCIIVCSCVMACADIILA